MVKTLELLRISNASYMIISRQLNKTVKVWVIYPVSCFMQ